MYFYCTYSIKTKILSMLGTGYFLKIANINSQQKKPICHNGKTHFPQNTRSHPSAKINYGKNFVPHDRTVLKLGPYQGAIQLSSYSGNIIQTFASPFFKIRLTNLFSLLDILSTWAFQGSLLPVTKPRSQNSKVSFWNVVIELKVRKKRHTFLGDTDQFIFKVH